MHATAATGHDQLLACVQCVREAFDWHTPPLSVFRRHIGCSWHLQATSSTLLHAMVTRESLRDVERWPHVGHVPNDFRSAARDRGQVRGVHCGRTSEGHTHAHVHTASLTRVARCSWTSLAPRSNARQIRQRCLHQPMSSSGSFSGHWVWQWALLKLSGTHACSA